ncbi:MAG: hypothetical protein ABSE73_22225 [Planctomycetota bacterium]
MKKNKIAATGIAARVRQVVDKVYGGSVARAAEALGTDRTVIHRACVGERTLRRSSLMLLSRVAGVSLEWLESGGSETIQPAERSAEYLPVLCAPIAGPPRGSPQRRQCLPGHFQPGNYWLLANKVPGFSAERWFLLVEPCSQRPVRVADMNKLRILKKGEDLKLERVGAHDAKGKEVVGEVLVAEIDFP